MNAYRIVILHQGLHALAENLEGTARQIARDILPYPNLIQLADELTDEKIPQIVVYLVSRTDEKDDQVFGVIDKALEQNVPILPVVKEEWWHEIIGQLPENLSHLNAVKWNGESTAVVTVIFEWLGLVESARKVFISYRQSLNSSLAIQLHDKLVQCRFDVFLDRFSVEPGEGFQRRLEEDLGDKAFVLLLESRNLLESKWVRHEVSYSLAHRIQILALTLPDCQEDKLVDTIDEAFRFRLTDEDLKADGSLTSNALQTVLDMVELSHAKALRRRREQILGSVLEKLRHGGYTLSSAGDWCVFATKSNTRARLLLVTPRRPIPTDFFNLDQKHQQWSELARSRSLKSSVIHESGRLAEDHQKLLEWLSSVSGHDLESISTFEV